MSAEREEAMKIITRNRAARLSEEDRAKRDTAIRADRATGMKVAEVATRHGVSNGQVSKIVHAATVEDQDDDMQWAAPSDYAPQTATEGPKPSPSATTPGATYSPAQAPADGGNTPPVTPVEASNSHGTHTDTPEPLTALHTTAVSEARRATAPDELPEGPERVVFSHSAATRAVWHAARARLGSPWAVLGCVLSATVAATGPHLQLPALVGGPGSLNLLVSLVGEPGSGKGTAEGIAHHLFTITDEHGNEIEVPELPLGTGEGVAELFTRRDQPGDAPTAPTPDRVVFRIPEIDALAAASSKRESTIMPVLRQAFMAEPLGHTGASQATTRNVPAHTYRVAVVMGVQPRRSGALLADADGGTPQRVLWCPTAYPGAPDVTPPAPPTHTIRLPRGARNGNSPLTITLPPHVEHQVRENRLRRLRGQAAEGLDGHLLLTQEKTAAALALIDGRTNVTEGDWTAAGAVIDLSTATRETCRTAYRGLDEDRAVEREETRDAAMDRVSASRAARARRLIEDALKAGNGRCSRSELNRRARKYRDEFSDVCEEMTEARQIACDVDPATGKTWLIDLR
ncbi:hypothetical protein ACTXK0_12830 [Corynebacterium variabile]|uniref:hypothetical protein n=2 Tax=Corynebacterium variabile TaxID=1727 RepID=UPI003FD0721B